MSMRAVFPSRGIILLIGIGFVDLLSTAWLYHRGMIVELNPLMRVLLKNGEWPFVLVKGLTLVFTWVALAKYSRLNPSFVRSTCLIGSIAYVSLWATWFTIGNR
jgi:hypothetical protein